ncbi:MAG: type II secretion system F family protein [Streptosporangiales bacterium]|nr:type II secretion system F family protein [Streptosporangiales bacterium]
MSPLPVLAAVVVAATVPVLFVWGWYLVRYERLAERYSAELDLDVRPAARRWTRSGAPLTALAEALGRRFAPMLLRLMGPARLGRIRRRINAAGRPNGMTSDTYAARKAGFLLVFGLLGLVMLAWGNWIVGLLLIAVGWFWADLSLLILARQRQYEIERTLPDFLDVLSVTVSAGLSFRHALTRVSESMPGPLAEEFSTALRQMEVGTSRREAFEELRARNSNCEPLSQFVTAVLQAEELGAPLTRALIEISEDMRRESAQSARRRAARAAPRVTLIVTTVMVPGAIILLAGALFIGGEATLPDVLFD